jgi:hypothetical protein
MTNELRGLYTDLALVADQIATHARRPGSTLGWHPAARGAPFHAISLIVTAIALLAYVGTMWFFMRSRAAGGVGFRK